MSDRRYEVYDAPEICSECSGTLASCRGARRRCCPDCAHFRRFYRLPDALVEEAAKAMYEAQYPGFDFSKALRPSGSQFRALARAALSVLFPGEEEE